MELDWKYSLDGIHWQALSELYRSTPLGNKRPEDLETAFTNSRFHCFVLAQDRLVGVGRALADGVDCSYICDVAVLPEYQGLGIGRRIVSRLVELSHGHRKIILYACPGKESFYRQFGFKRMCTAMAIFENQDQAIESGLVDEM